MSLFGGLISGVGSVLGIGGGGDANGIGNSKSTSDTSTSSVSTSTDSRRINTGGNGVNAADGSTINYTATADGAFDIVDSVIGKTFQSQQQLTSALSNAYADAKGNGADTSKLLMLAMGAVVAVAFIMKKA